MSRFSVGTVWQYGWKESASLPHERFAKEEKGLSTPLDWDVPRWTGP